MGAADKLGTASPAWLEGVIYQVYLRSFYDANGDGVGDLPGVRARLDYLQWLGVQALWLTPFYPSPLLDSGYDTSDFTGVHPLFGSMQDFDELVADAHRRGMKILIDFVPNHTSHEHPWFLDSSSSLRSSRRDWYYWRDPAPNGGPPNNWLSEYGRSAWSWHEATGQYYLHSFLAEQPDLNWRNEEMRQAMWSSLRFWLERDIDGVRIDALPWMMKDPWFRDHPPNPNYREGQENPSHQFLPVFAQDQPELADIIGELRRIIDRYPERVLLGEIRLPVQRFSFYYNAGLHFPFNYQLSGSDWQALQIRRSIDHTEALLGNKHWPNWFLGTHDESRVATRLGPERARLGAMLVLTLRGTPVLYYGEELGLVDGDIPPERVQDSYEKLLPGYDLGRDPQRTPMPWTPGPHAGFSAKEPWLPLADGYDRRNVETLRVDSRSILTLYRRLIDLRQTDAFRRGYYLPDVAQREGFAYRRMDQDQGYLVALNFTDQPLTLHTPTAQGIVRLSTFLDGEGQRVSDVVTLRPYEGQVIQLRSGG